MFASNSGTEVGVVSNGELDGDDNSPIMVKAVQAGAEWAAGVVVVVVNRGCGAGANAPSQFARHLFYTTGTGARAGILTRTCSIDRGGAG